MGVHREPDVNSGKDSEEIAQDGGREDEIWTAGIMDVKEVTITTTGNGKERRVWMHGKRVAYIQR